MAKKTATAEESVKSVPLTLEVDITKSQTWKDYNTAEDLYNKLSPDKKEQTEALHLQRQIKRLLYLSLMIRVNELTPSVNEGQK